MKRLMVKIGKSYIFVKSSDIDFIESEGNYVRLNIMDKSYLIRDSLNNIEKKLDPDFFIRINRSTIINLDRLKELRAVENYNYEVVLENDKKWFWGRKFRDNLLNLINA